MSERRLCGDESGRGAERPVRASCSPGASGREPGIPARSERRRSGLAGKLVPAMEMLTPGSVRALLTENSLRPKKSLGQHFLADPNTARRIVDARRSATRRPGARDRTRARVADAGAARRAVRVSAVELDAHWPRVLESVLDATVGPDSDRSTCTVGDALHRRSDRAARQAARSGRACPTCRTTSRSRWSCGCSRKPPPSTRFVVMVQREVGERLAAGPGGKEYGAVLGEGRLLRRGALVGVVPPTVFVPRPKVDSVLVQLRRARGAAGLGAVGAGALHARARRVRPAPQDAAQRAAPAARRARRRRARVRRRRTHGPRRGARARRVGRARPVRSGRGMSTARRRATAFPKLTLSLRVLGRRADGFHDLEALVVSLGQPHDVLEAYAVPAPGGVRLELVGDDATNDVPTDHTNLAFIAAEKLIVRAGRSGHGVRLVLRKRIPAGAGLGGGSADAAAALLAVRRLLEMDVDDARCARSRPRSGPTCRSASRVARRGCADGARSSSRSTSRAGSPFLVAIPPFRLSTPDVYAAWDDLGGPVATAHRCPRRAASPAPPRARQRPRAGGRGRRAAARGVPRRRSKPRPAVTGAARGQRLGLRGAGAGRAAAPRPRAKVRRRLRVPVVGTTSVSRGVARLDPTANRRHQSAIPPADAGRRKTCLAALLAALPARSLQQLLVLLLPHALAALLDQ